MANANATFRVWADTAANWTAVNPTVPDRELAFETDTRKFKVGTGVAWNSTSYISSGAAPPWIISDTTGLQAALDLKANLNNPALTGASTAQAPAAASNNSRIITAAWYQTEVASKADLASPALTGAPTAPTATLGDSTTKLATTAFVGAAIGAISAPNGLAPTGGTTGQVLKKNSATNFDYSWAADATGGTAAWGGITGTLSAQTDLDTALGLKAPLASPALTGAPTVPTATGGTNTTQAASTAFVTAAIGAIAAPSGLAPIGGTTGQVLKKNSATDYDYSWGASTPVWGAITGTLSSQTDLQSALDLKANAANAALTGAPTAPTPTAGLSTTRLATTAFVQGEKASPAFTGTPTAPTAAAGTNTTQIATTAYADAADALKAPLASPALTGSPTAPTAAANDNSTKLATTAYVDTADALKAPLASPAFTGSPTAPTQTAGDNSTKLATTAYVDAADYAVTPVLTGDVTNSSNATVVDITGVGFALVSGNVYHLRFLVPYSSAATTTAIALLLNSLGMTFFYAAYSIPVAANGSDAYYEATTVAPNTAAVGAGVAVANTVYLATVDIICKPSASGTLTIRFRSSVNSSQITVKVGAFGICRKIG